MTEKQETPRLHYVLSCNLIAPEATVRYRGEIVRYAYEWERGKEIHTTTNNICLVDDGSSHPQLLPNVDQGTASFSWGYGGSGPCGLALSLLAHHLGEWPKRGAPYGGLPFSHLMHHDLVHDYVSRWPIGEGWTLASGALANWVALWRASHPDAWAERERAVREMAELDAELDRLDAAEEAQE